jgi:hypothetical protein
MAFTGRQPGRSVGVERLVHSRDVALTGDVSGSVAFDGTANVAITTTVADDSHNHIINNVDGLQDALDNIELLTLAGL